MARKFTPLRVQKETIEIHSFVSVDKKSPLRESWQQHAVLNKKQYKRFLNRARIAKILPHLLQEHRRAFASIDCLQCASCCKGYSPRFKTTDIKRISKFLGLRESAFIAGYLEIDSDGDYVLQKEPCAFLGNDNRCSIYAVRPSDCARFPYTSEDVFLKRQNITLKNVTFCPIAFTVMESLMNNNNPK